MEAMNATDMDVLMVEHEAREEHDDLAAIIASSHATQPVETSRRLGAYRALVSLSKKRNQRNRAELAANKASGRELLGRIAILYPSIGRVFNLKLPGHLSKFDSVGMELKAALAFAPKIKSRCETERLAQNQAMLLVSWAGRSIQEQCAATYFGPGTVREHFSGGHQTVVVPLKMPRDDRAGFRDTTMCLRLVWDEADQRVARRRSTRTNCVHRGPTSAQGCKILGMGGLMSKYVTSDDVGSVFGVIDPLIFRPVRLKQGRVVDIVQGFLKELPILLEQVGHVQGFLAESREQLAVLWLLLGADRGSSNPGTACYLTHKPTVACLRVLPHIEWCCGHGIMLIRKRPQPAKRLNVAITSFTKWSGISINSRSLNEAIGRLVDNDPFTWFQSERPKEEVEAAEKLKRLLFPDDTPLWRMQKTASGGERWVKSSLHLDFDSLMACRRFCEPDGISVGFVHWCKRLRTPSDCEGLSLQPQIYVWCCSSEAEARCKTKDALEVWATERKWPEAADNKWTTQPIAHRRYCAADVVQGYLTRALLGVRQALNLQKQSVVAALLKLIENNKDDFKSKNMVRLSNICDNLTNAADGGSSGIHIRLAGMLVVGQALDEVFYSLLGATGVKPRLTLGDLLHPIRSPLLKCMDTLCELVTHFTADSDRYTLCALLGMDFSDDTRRSQMRHRLIVTMGALFFYFDLRFSAALYKASTSALAPADCSHRRRTVFEFYSSPHQQCQPLSAQRLRQIYPRASELLQKCDLVFFPFHADTSLINDWCEQFNARLRTDLNRPAGPGCNFTKSANRMLVRMMSTAHIAKGGLDPRSKQALKLSGVQELSSCFDKSSKKQTTGGSAWLEFHNMRMASLADVHRMKQEKSATPVSLDTVAAEIQVREEWGELCNGDDEAYNSFLELSRAKRARRRLAPLQDGLHESQADGGKLVPYYPLWGASDTRHSVLRADVLRHAYEQLRGKSQKEKAVLRCSDPDLEVDSIAEDLFLQCDAASEAMRRELEGCCAGAKNVCREHMVSPVNCMRIDSLTGILTQFVESLGKENAHACNTVFLWRGLANNKAVAPIYFWRLLVDCRWSPKMQILAVVTVAEFNGANEIAFPLSAEIALCPPRMECWGERHLFLPFETSDELCLKMVEAGDMSWSLCPVMMRWADGNNLLAMHLDGLQDEFRPLARAARASKAASSSDFLFSADPWSEEQEPEAVQPTEASSHVPPDPASSSDSCLDGLAVNAIAEDDEGYLRDGGVELSTDDDIDNEGELSLCAEGGNVGDPGEDVVSDLAAFAVASDAPGDLAAFAVAEPPESGVPEVTSSGSSGVAIAHAIAAPKANQVILRGRVFTRLKNRCDFSGYSLQCPTCGVHKDLHHVNSGMEEDEALNRLERWADSCREGHKRWGGRLLVLCASAS